MKKEILFCVIGSFVLFATLIRAFFLYISLDEEKCEKADSIVNETIINLFYK